MIARKSFVFILILSVIGFSIPYVPRARATGFTNVGTITISTSKVPSDQTNFPVEFTGTYQQLKTTGNGGTVTSSSGFDIEFFTNNDCSTGKLNWETEKWDGTTGSVVYWVKLATVSHSSPTTFYICSGNASVTTDQSNTAGVWDSNFLLVDHMANNAANTNVTNSASTTDTGTSAQNTNAIRTSGEINGAFNFNGSSDYVSVPQHNQFNLHASAFTIEGWIQDDTAGTGALQGDFHRAVSWYDGSQNIQMGLSSGNVGGTRSFYVSSGSGCDGVKAYTAAPGSGLHHVVATFDGGSTYTIYMDGSASSGSDGPNCSDAYTGDTTNIYLGQRGNGEFWVGREDEMRISKSVRSADWITTEYNNQFNPSTFYSVSGLTSSMALVQTKSCDGCSTLAFDSSVTAGDAIIVSYRCGGAAVTPSFTDTLGDSFSEADHGDNAADGNTRLSISYALNTGGGADTLTPSGIGSCASNRWAIAEYSGLAHTNALDQHVGNSFGNVSSFTTSNITTEQPGEVLICAVEHADNTDWRTQSPFSSEVFDTKIDMGDQMVSSTGTYNCGVAGTASADGGSTVLASFTAPKVWNPLTSGINHADCNAGADPTSLAATSGAVIVGDVIFVSLNYDIGPTTDPVISDNLGNTYTSIDNEHDATNGQDVHLWVSFVTHSGTPTVTIQWDPSPGTTINNCADMIVDPFSGSDTSSATDGFHGNFQVGPGTGTDAITSTTYSTTKDGDLIYTMSGDTGNIDNANWPSGTGQTGLTNIAGGGASGAIITQSEYLIQGSHSGSTAGTWTALIGGDPYGTISVAVTPAGTGGGGGPVTTSGLPKFNIFQGVVSILKGIFFIR